MRDSIKDCASEVVDVIFDGVQSYIVMEEIEDVEEYCTSLEERVEPIIKKFLEDSYKQGYDAGNEEGREAGYEDGLASALDEI